MPRFRAISDWGMMFAVTLAAGISVPALSADHVDAAGANAPRGRELFMRVGCYECHGTVGQGAPATGPRLAPNPLPQAAFSALVRHPSNVMPAYSERILSDAELADIYAYLKSIAPSPPASQIFR